MPEIKIAGSAPVESLDPEYLAELTIHQAHGATETDLRALVDAARAELGEVSEWSATWTPWFGEHAETPEQTALGGARLTLTFRAPNRKDGRERPRLALLAVQRVNGGRGARHDRLKARFVRNFTAPEG